MMDDITEEDFIVFKYLDDVDKILYFFDILLELHNINEAKEEEEYYIDSDVDVVDNKKYFKTMKDFITYTANPTDTVSVHCIDDLIVFNSQDYGLMQSAISEVMMLGNILVSETEDFVEKCQIKNYCAVYRLTGLGNQIISN